MAYRVTWTDKARANLRSILRYIRSDSPDRAKIVSKKLVASTARLVDFPYSGRVIPEIGDPDSREIFVYSYRLMYHVSPGRVSIYKIVHERLGTNEFTLGDHDTKS